ncbi:MAG: ATP-binding cassette domain-containing protein [Desulfobacteraceae bacterium]|nr:MAG: ATP-binding cassette domain-containing protein [Desulfobacteraceae bacterium]
MHVQCRHIHFRYPGTDRLLLKDLSLNYAAAGLHALFGPSGVGKSSLARIISGQLQAENGQLSIDDMRPPLYAHNLERLPGWSGIGRHLERVTPDGHLHLKNDLVRICELTSLLNRRFDRLSLGQQNRVNLVRYLVQDFGVLLLDETLANVDEKMRSRILMAIKEMFPQKIFIYISHNVVEVATYCRDIWVLRAPHKHPQASMVQGQDQRSQHPAEHHSVQESMLEIVNAA